MKFKLTTSIVYANGHEYIDLGLPSGTLWAKMNVGAKKETDAGLYFAWGETTGYAAGHKRFSWDDYKYESVNHSTKYDQDGLTKLELTDDAAAVNMGCDWCMPTKAQCEELFKETKNGFVTNTGVFMQFVWGDNNHHSTPASIITTINNWDTAGHIFFKKSYATVTEAIAAKDYLFFPAAGDCHNCGVSGVGGIGYVWSSSLDTSNFHGSWCFYFGCYGAGVGYDGRGIPRCHGLSVRGVISK